MIERLKSFFPHLIVILLFGIAALAYFSPVLKGQKMLQSDITQYRGMANEQTQFREKTGEEPYWTNSAFGGMPTYQLGAQYPHYYVKKLDKLIRFLPRPADYLFLYFISFYVLMLVLKVDYRLAFVGSLAFGFSTYFLVILGVGHNAKAHAIGYMPFVLSGILLCFQRKYILGFIVLTLGMALEIVANHFQMTYYLFLLVLALGISFLVKAYREKQISGYFKSVGIMVVAVLFAVLMNATSILATQEYTQYSTRGKSELTTAVTGEAQNNGLSYEYITQYSYGIVESLNLFISRAMGGGSTESLDTDSAFYNQLKQMGIPAGQAKDIIERAPTYWGDQLIVAAPAYIGVTVVFLFVLGLFLVKGKHKWWLAAGTVLTLLLSYGDNFSALTKFFVNYIPLYNKFRAVSSIQVIVELCLPILAILGVSYWLKDTHTTEEKKKALLYSSGIVGGLILLMLLFKNTFFDFSGANDSYYREQFGIPLMNALKEDRKSMFTTDALRGLFFIGGTAGILYLFLIQKINRVFLIASLGILFLLDLIPVGRRYVNADNFVSNRVYEQPFQASAADQEILNDKGHFRVMDQSGDPFNSGKPSYFHKAFGGYHGAKPRKFQDIVDYQLAKGNMKPLHMFNVKYIIQRDPEKGAVVRTNPEANGNAWFVSTLKPVSSADEEILALEQLDTKKEAVLRETYLSEIPLQQFTVDSTAQIQLTSYAPNHLVYSSNNQNDGFAVFSEMYYPHGWQAYIDEQPVPHYSVDYTLRGLFVPKGKHTIEFRFEPQVVKTGSTITLASSILFILLALGAIWYTNKNRRQEVGA